MRVNSINNVNQRQQSFGAVPGKNFSKGLAEFMAIAFGSPTKAAEELYSLKSLDFIRQISDMRFGSKNIEPVIDIEHEEGNDIFRISASLSGIEDNFGFRINPKKDLPRETNPFDFLASWAKLAVEQFERTVMPTIRRDRENSSVKENAKALTRWIYAVK